MIWLFDEWAVYPYNVINCGIFNVGSGSIVRVTVIACSMPRGGVIWLQHSFSLESKTSEWLIASGCMEELYTLDFEFGSLHMHPPGKKKK